MPQINLKSFFYLNIVKLSNNYYNYQMNKIVTLTPAQKSKIENQKQLYVLIRLINMVQQYHNYDKISTPEYRSEMSKLIEKYNRFAQILPNFNFKTFTNQHQMPQEQVSWAKLALERGIGNDQNKKKETFLYMQATAKFIEVNDRIAMNAEQPVIGEIKTSIQELLMILKNIHSKIGVEFTQKYLMLQKIFNNYLNNRAITQVLSSSQFNELRLTIQSMYRILELSMKN